MHARGLRAGIRRFVLASALAWSAAFPAIASKSYAAGAPGDAPEDTVYAAAQKLVQAGFKDDELMRHAAGDTQRIMEEREFDARIAVLAQRGDLASAFRLSVLATLSLPADHGFPQRLLRALSLVEYSERGTGVAVMERWAQPLFAAAATLPPDTLPFQAARCIHAAHLALRGDLDGQKEILETLVRDSMLLDELRPKVFAALAGLLERTNHPELAASAYARLLDHPLPAVDQCSALLRSTLLHLHIGDRAGATRMLAAAAKADPWARGCATGPEQMDDLLQLFAAGRVDYWERWRAWWPLWEKIVARQKLPPAGMETTVPVIANEYAIRAALRPATESFDVVATLQEIRRVVSAVRWHPRHVSHFGAWIYSIDRLAPELTADFRGLVIAMLESSRDLLEGTARREADLWLAIACADAGKPARSLALLPSLREQCAGDPDFSARVTRMFAVAALTAKTEVATAAAELEQLLAGDRPVRDRADLVTILSDLWWTMKNHEAEARLLEREVAHPDVKAARRDHGRLVARLMALQQPLDEPSEPVLAAANSSAPPYDCEPRLIRRVEPLRPTALQRQGITGRVQVDFLVGASGRVIAVRTSGAHPILGEIAAAAVAKWEFEPAIREGIRASARMRVPIYFPDAEPETSPLANLTAAP